MLHEDREEVVTVKSTSKTSVHRMSNGTYRVGSRRFRSAISGRFVTKQASKRRPELAGNNKRAS